uniref:Large ribosomal subunit protein uL29m n=1 Tax=Odontella aurita TaxID=265563 RepID=A0A7S4IRP3_9STRA|mmetsp:Transcript_29339/g.86953  ORF Transcript_29339/g.86953 Transcript_29339/m.86953 type:complete len:186 (+) Transcript_29339:75-632(+)
MLSLISIGRITRSACGNALRQGPQFRPIQSIKPDQWLSNSRWWYSTSRPALGLEEFRDSVPREQRVQEKVGRSWKVKELRRKSFDDIWRLWLVLYKERNMLLTEKQILRRRNLEFPQPERWRKVKKSMQAIRHVMGERKREKIAAAKQKRRESEAQDAIEESVEIEDDEFDEDDEFEESTQQKSK